VASYNKKRARELQKDVFREKTMSVFEKLGERLEGQGRSILYGIGALILVGIAVWGFVAWRGKRSDEASRALGRAIDVTQAPVTSSPAPGTTGPTFTSDKDRSQRAVDEFQKVANKYSGQTREIANYFIATNLLNLDRPKGISQLQTLTKSSDSDVSARSKFALASAYESDGKLDEAAALYKELVQAKTEAVPVDTANLRLAIVYEKQGKKQDSANILYEMVSGSRKAQDKAGKPLPASAASRDAEKELEKLDPARYAQLPPEPTPAGFPAA
jgi:tetratricopeptide (TPR) repeat protein